MSWSIDWSQNLASIQFVGITTVEDLVAANAACQSDSRFGGLRAIVFDLSQVDAFLGLEKLSSCVEDMWTTDHASMKNNPRVQKLMVTDNSLVKAFAREYIVRPKPAIPLRIYEDLEEAMCDARNLASG